MLTDLIETNVKSAKNEFGGHSGPAAGGPDRDIASPELTKGSNGRFRSDQHMHPRRMQDRHASHASQRRRLGQLVVERHVRDIRERQTKVRVTSLEVLQIRQRAGRLDDDEFEIL